jgi:hypothetical protein
MPGSLILEVLRHVWTALSAVNVPKAVAGGIGLSAWKYVRATQDVDLLVGIGSGELDGVLNSLA